MTHYVLRMTFHVLRFTFHAYPRVTRLRTAGWDGVKMRGIKTYHTADEFFKIARSLGPCELVDGEIQLMEPAGGEHGEIALRIGGRLLVFVEEHDLGKAFAAETGYILQHAQKEGERDTVKGIDASFIRKERIPPEGIPKKFIPFPPDLAVEVVSPGDTKKGAGVFRFRRPPRLGSPSEGKNCDRVSCQWGGRSEAGRRSPLRGGCRPRIYPQGGWNFCLMFICQEFLWRKQ